MSSLVMYVSGRVCFFKQKTAYEMSISDWRSDVCSSDRDPRVHRLIALNARFGRVAQLEMHERCDNLQTVLDAVAQFGGQNILVALQQTRFRDIFESDQQSAGLIAGG